MFVTTNKTKALSSIRSEIHGGIATRRFKKTFRLSGVWAYLSSYKHSAPNGVCRVNGRQSFKHFAPTGLFYDHLCES